MQQHAPRHAAAGGRHRRTSALPTHRAPREPLAAALSEKSRYAMAAAVVAGVGVAGAASTSGDSSPARASVTHVSPPHLQAPATMAQAQLREQNQAEARSTAQSISAQMSRAVAAGASAAVPALTGPSSGVAGISPVGGLDSGYSVEQRFKTRPQPVLAADWVNPMPEGAVTSCFGERWGRLHAGVDIATAEGTPIRAVGAGVVVAAGPADGYGNAVLIDHSNGYLTHYGHMSAITVAVGQRVTTGAQIGNEGSTGHSTGPHLHFEVHEGRYKNPIEPTLWLHQHGVDIPGCVPLTDEQPETTPEVTASR